jgi:hypothetical protein
VGVGFEGAFGGEIGLGAAFMAGVGRGVGLVAICGFGADAEGGGCGVF